MPEDFFRIDRNRPAIRPERSVRSPGRETSSFCRRIDPGQSMSLQEPVNNCHEAIGLYLPVLRGGLRSRRVHIGEGKARPGRLHRLRRVVGFLAGAQDDSLSAGLAGGTSIFARRRAAVSDGLDMASMSGRSKNRRGFLHPGASSTSSNSVELRCCSSKLNVKTPPFAMEPRFWACWLSGVDVMTGKIRTRRGRAHAVPVDGPPRNQASNPDMKGLDDLATCQRIGLPSQSTGGQ